MSIRFESYKSIVCAFAFLFIGHAVHAAGLVGSVTGFDVNESIFMRDYDLKLHGWVDMGETYSSHNPSHHDNSPITFNDRSGEFQMNQFYMYLEKPVDIAAGNWNLGGRIDFLFGTDSRFVQSTGLDDKWMDSSRLYQAALPQAYLEVFAPVGNGLSLITGHFYTIIGYELVTAQGNFFYSHAYTMQYGEPFTHTGILLSYPINDNWNLKTGAVLGWDNFDENAGIWNFLGSLSWSDDDAETNITWSVISGGVDESSSNNRTMYSLVLTHSFSEKLEYVFQHDFGYQEGAAANGQDALWYGINQYLFYDVSDTVSIGLRAEWFRDEDNTRLNIGAEASFFEITGGVNWSPFPWLTVRPEVRYDWVDSRANAFNRLTADDQLTIAADLIIVL